MKRKFNIYSKEGNFEYILKVKEKENGKMVYKLFTSDADHWSESFKNTKLIKVSDNGDGVKIKAYDFDFENGCEMGYDSVEYLRLILEIKNQLEAASGHIVSEYNVIEWDDEESDNVESLDQADVLIMSVIEDLMELGCLCKSKNG